MARQAKKLTKASLDALRKRAQADQSYTSYLADAGQAGLYVWTRRGRVRFVFAYRPPGIAAIGGGGDVVWSQTLTPEERQVLKKYFK